MANNSCCQIGYRVSAGSIFRDIKEIGRRCPLYFPCAHRCGSVAPTQSLEASVYRWYGCRGSMALRCIALIIACFSLSKAAWCLAVHYHSKSALNIAVRPAAAA